MYQLRDGVYLVRGFLNGALLDTLSGNVYSINARACEVIERKVEDESYWAMLYGLGLTEFVEIPKEKVLPVLTLSPQLDFVWFEVVTDDCNECCIHCYAGSMPRSYREQREPSMNHISLNKNENIENALSEKSRNRMKHADWISAVEEARELGCKKCQFIGGEPFLYSGQKKETVLDLAKHCVEIGYEGVEIYTNATLLTPAKVRRIKNLGLKVAVSLYSSDSKVHDSITRTSGSYAKTMRGLGLLKEAGVPTRVEIVIMKVNQETVEDTMRWRKENGFGGSSPDPLRPNGRGDDILLQPSLEYVVTYGIMTKPEFRTSGQLPAQYKAAHPCLYGKLALTEFGDILPCIFSRNNILGNFLEKGELSSTVFGERVENIWGITKDSVLVCKDCEYRYVCLDCRPLSEAAAHGRADYKDAPYPRCTYNPYSGEWGGGLWKLNENGAPYYDESFELTTFASQAVLESGAMKP